MATQGRETASSDEVLVTATLARRIAVSGLGLFGLGAASAVFAQNLPTAAVMGSMAVGAVATVLAGTVLLWRERRRNELAGYRWLRFWEGRLGDWTVKLAGVCLRRLPGEPARGEVAPSPAAELPCPAPSDLADLPDAVHLSQSCVRRIKAWLVASSSSRSLQGRTPTERAGRYSLSRAAGSRLNAKALGPEGQNALSTTTFNRISLSFPRL